MPRFRSLQFSRKRILHQVQLTEAWHHGNLLQRKSLSYGFCVDSYTLEDISQRALSYFKNEYEKFSTLTVTGFSFEFWIGGYSGHNKQGEIWKIGMADGQWHNPIQLVALKQAIGFYGEVKHRKSIGLYLNMTPGYIQFLGIIYNLTL